MINSIDDLFRKCGGAVHVAAALDLNQWTVERWKKAGIPNKYWPQIIKLYGVTPDILMSISNKALSSYKASLKAE